MITVAKLLRKLACLARGHQWEASWLQPLNLNFLAGEYSAECQRCGKHAILED